MEKFCLKAIEDIGCSLYSASKVNKEQVIFDLKIYFGPECIKEGMAEVLRYFESDETWCAFEIEQYNIDFRNQNYVSPNETYLPPLLKIYCFISFIVFYVFTTSNGALIELLV